MLIIAYILSISANHWFNWYIMNVRVGGALLFFRFRNCVISYIYMLRFCLAAEKMWEDEMSWCACILENLVIWGWQSKNLHLNHGLFWETLFKSFFSCFLFAWLARVSVSRLEVIGIHWYNELCVFFFPPIDLDLSCTWFWFLGIKQNVNKPNWVAPLVLGNLYLDAIVMY